MTAIHRAVVLMGNRSGLSMNAFKVACQTLICRLCGDFPIFGVYFMGALLHNSLSSLKNYCCFKYELKMGLRKGG